MATSTRGRARTLRSNEGRFLWAGLLVWLGLLVTAEVEAARMGPHRLHVEFLLAASIATLAAVTALALIGLRRVPAELRMLRLLAVVLPSVLVVAVELGLYVLAIDGVVSEVAQHIVATVVLSVGAVPFAIYVFRSFGRLRDQLRERAQRLEALHRTSLDLARASVGSHLERAIGAGARNVAHADSALVSWKPWFSGRARDEAVPRALSSPLPAGQDRADGPEGSGLRLEVPLIAAGRNIGVLTLIKERGAPFDAQDVLFAEMLAVAAVAGAENVRRLEETHLLAVTHERERIARDLHDDLGQLLGYLTTKVQAAQELLARGRTADAGLELASLGRAAQGLGTEVREAILGLRAKADEGPLGRTISDYVADFGVLADIDVAFDGSDDAGRDLPPPIGYEVLQIAREALSNARRHAKARTIRVGLDETPNGLELTVADDGQGYDPATQTRGFGLRTMTERAEAIGAILDVRTAPGAGTQVRVTVPAMGDDDAGAAGG